MPCNLRRPAVRTHPPLMQDNDGVVLGDFVDEVRSPQNRYAVFARKFVRMGHKARARLDIQPDRRFIEDQDLGAADQCTGDLHPPPVPAIEAAHDLGSPPPETEAVKDPRDLLSGSGAPDATQPTVVGKIALHAEIRVEGRFLENQPQSAERPATVCNHIVSSDPDGAASWHEKASEARQQGGLAGAIGTEQSDERTLRHPEVDTVQHLAVAITV